MFFVEDRLDRICAASSDTRPRPSSRDTAGEPRRMHLDRIRALPRSSTYLCVWKNSEACCATVVGSLVV